MYRWPHRGALWIQRHRQLRSSGRRSTSLVKFSKIQYWGYKHNCTVHADGLARSVPCISISLHNHCRGQQWLNTMEAGVTSGRRPPVVRVEPKLFWYFGDTCGTVGRIYSYCIHTSSILYEHWRIISNNLKCTSASASKMMFKEAGTNSVRLLCTEGTSRTVPLTSQLSFSMFAYARIYSRGQIPWFQSFCTPVA